MTCTICHGRLTVPVAGPDEFGNYDTDDCPCQIEPTRECEQCGELLDPVRAYLCKQCEDAVVHSATEV